MADNPKSCMAWTVVHFEVDDQPMYPIPPCNEPHGHPGPHRHTSREQIGDHHYTDERGRPLVLTWER